MEHPLRPVPRQSLADDLAAQHPEFLRAKIKLLEELVAGQPKYIAGRTKLKKLYVEANLRDKAAALCVELARLHEEKGETEEMLYARLATVHPGKEFPALAELTAELSRFRK